MLYYLLRGDLEEIARAELKALIETYRLEVKDLFCLTSICLVDKDVGSVERIIGRAGLLKEAGYVYGLDPVYERSYGYLDEINVVGRIDYHIVKSTCREKDVKEYVEELGKKVVRRRDGGWLKVYCSENVAVVVKPLSKLSTIGLANRKPSRRPFFRSIALTPHLARLLINLSRVKENDVILDPFAGTGSILIEAGFMGIRGVGVDLDPELASGMKINVDHYGLINQIVIHADSLELLLNRFDSIATDPPYGRSASLHKVDVKQLYSRFLEFAKSFVKKGGFIVFLTDRRFEDHVDESIYRNNLLIYDKHYMFIHGGLTRVVYEVVNV